MWHRKRSIDDFDEEIRAHIELEAERLKRRGVPEEEARRRAYVNFGNVMRAKERFYESRRPTWFSDLIQDLQYAARMLSRSRGIAIVAILTLALGIGANTAIFSVLDPLLLQNLPVRDPNSLVRVDAVGTISNIGMWEGERTSVSGTKILLFRASCRSTGDTSITSAMTAGPVR